jgi:hypothetical protein
LKNSEKATTRRALFSSHLSPLSSNSPPSSTTKTSWKSWSSYKTSEPPPSNSRLLTESLKKPLRLIGTPYSLNSKTRRDLLLTRSRDSAIWSRPPLPFLSNLRNLLKTTELNLKTSRFLSNNRLPGAMPNQTHTLVNQPLEPDNLIS